MGNGFQFIDIILFAMIATLFCASERTGTSRRP